MTIQYQQRITHIRSKFKQWNVEAILISDDINRRWVSGFTGSAGQVIITADQAILVVDSRYWEQAADQAPDFTLFKLRNSKEELKKLYAQTAVSRIALSARHTTLAHKKMLDNIPDIEWVILHDPISPMRFVKTIAELQTIRRAAAITDSAMAKVNTWARPGVNERELAWMLEKEMRQTGADGMAFDIIVAAGKNSAHPHHTPSNYQLQAGDMLTVDMGAKVNGYHSDMTRAFYLGAEPTAEFWQIYNLVLAAHTAVIENARPGMNNHAIDAFARTLINDAGHKEHFGHGLGHGVGLEIHENPHIGSSESAKKRTAVVGMTLTIEPGIYIPDWGGIRIEDLGVMGEYGIELISHCPKAPIIPI